MTMGEDRKPKTFIIHYRPTKRQRVEVDRLSVPLRHLPENLLSITITCPTCRTVFSPDWFKKHEIPMVPVKPKLSNGVEYTGQKRWILQEMSQQCPRCKGNVVIPLPGNKMRAKGFLFGDDAEREHKNKKVYIYSLVGADQSLLTELEMKVKTLKQSLLPSISANSWKIHMKYMWPSSSRAKHPAYQSLSSKDTTSFVDQLLALIKESNLFIYNIALTTGQNNPTGMSDQNRLRNEAYIT
jgi:hypothetical protein